MMVSDTLFALDAQGTAQPQMLAGYVVEKNDQFGRALMDATDELSAPSNTLVQPAAERYGGQRALSSSCR